MYEGMTEYWFGWFLFGIVTGWWATYWYFTDRLIDKKLMRCSKTGKEAYVKEEDCHCFCCGKHDGLME